MQLTKRRIQTFQSYIFSWWTTHRRDLPWRKTRDPYHIMVSEIMLQQTQVSRVLPKYQEFLLRFPDIHALAHASVADVVKAWKGMGYNRRALYLKRAAEAIVQTEKDIFPDAEQELTKLPGLGTYTARAILVFAYGKDVAMVDTNIRQIIMHYFFHNRKQKDKTIQHVADQLLPVGKSWEWHQALMDYGALALSKRKSSKKEAVPFQESNRFFRGKIIDQLRVKSMKRPQLTHLIVANYGKTTSVISSLIDSLKKDGLITEGQSGVLHLPE